MRTNRYLLINVTFFFILSFIILNANNAYPAVKDETPSEYIKTLANEGDAEAQYRVAMSLLTKKSRSKAELLTAIRWLIISSINDYVPALFQLGYIYYSGYGIAEDRKKAFEYYKKSAESGLTEAENNLGVLYRLGIGTKKNLALAFLNFKRAADKGYPKAQYNLAKLYYNGEYVDKNYEVAAYYYTLAAELGNHKAQQELAEMYKKGIGVKKDLAMYKILKAEAKESFDEPTSYTIVIDDSEFYQ